MERRTSFEYQVANMEIAELYIWLLFGLWELVRRIPVFLLMSWLAKFLAKINNCFFGLIIIRDERKCCTNPGLHMSIAEKSLEYGKFGGTRTAYLTRHGTVTAYFPKTQELGACMMSEFRNFRNSCLESCSPETIMQWSIVNLNVI